MTTENTPAPLVRGQAPRALQRVTLGRNVVLQVAALTSIKHARIYALASREVESIANEAPTAREWGLSALEHRAIRDEPEARAAVYGWMQSVLLAEACVVEVEGVVEKDGSPVAVDFDLFRWMLKDAQFEVKFRLAALASEQLYVSEGNASGRGPSGSGATASTIAPDAAPPMKPAAGADESSAQMEPAGADAPSGKTPPEPSPETSSGESAPAPASGSEAG